MNNLYTLFKAELINGFGMNKLLQPGKGHAGRRVLVLTAALPVIFLVFSLSAVYMTGLARLLKMADAYEYYTAFALIVPWICVFLVSLYLMPGSLLDFEDYDLLLTLPVRPSIILLSKILFLYLMNTGLSLLLSGPIFVIDGISRQVGPLYYILAVLSVPLLPLVPMVAAALASFLIGLLSVRFRSAQYVMIGVTILILLFVCLTPLLLSGGMTESSDQVEVVARLTGTICSVLFPSLLLMQAVQDSDVMRFLLFIAVNALPFLFFLLIFSRHFVAIRAKLREGGHSFVYRLTSLKTSRVPMALLKKELRRYFGTYVYVINTCFGMILVTFLVVIVCTVPLPAIEDTIALLVHQNILLPVFTFALAFSACMSCTTECSISLDGQTLWLDQSLPIPVTRIFFSKIALNLLITLPLLLIDTVILSLKFSFSSPDSFLIFAVPALYSVLIACCGLLINLHFPKLVWKSPEAPVKQSLSVLITAMLGFIMILIPVAAYFLMQPDFLLFSWILVMVLVAANLIAVLLLRTRGVRLYDHLE